MQPVLLQPLKSTIFKWPSFSRLNFGIAERLPRPDPNSGASGDRFQGKKSQSETQAGQPPKAPKKPTKEPKPLRNKTLEALILKVLEKLPEEWVETVTSKSIPGDGDQRFYEITLKTPKEANGKQRKIIQTDLSIHDTDLVVITVPPNLDPFAALSYDEKSPRKPLALKIQFEMPAGYTKSIKPLKKSIPIRFISSDEGVHEIHIKDMGKKKKQKFSRAVNDLFKLVFGLTQHVTKYRQDSGLLDDEKRPYKNPKSGKVVKRVYPVKIPLADSWIRVCDIP